MIITNKQTKNETRAVAMKMVAAGCGKAEVWQEAVLVRKARAGFSEDLKLPWKPVR